jgi:hypothetical protein
MAYPTLVLLLNMELTTISGIVKNSSRNGLEGVRVKLGKADMTATTGSDGSFMISKNRALAPTSGLQAAEQRQQEETTSTSGA